MSLSGTERKRLGALARVMIPGWRRAAPVRMRWASRAPRWTMCCGSTRREPGHCGGFLALDGPIDTLAGIEALAQCEPDGVRGGVRRSGQCLFHASRNTPPPSAIRGRRHETPSVGLGEADLALVDVVAGRGPVFRRI